MLTAQEEAELAQLEQEFAPRTQVINNRQAAQVRAPGDLKNVPMKMLSPEEEAELVALESEFAQPDMPLVEDKSVMTQVGEFVDTYSGAAPLRKAIGTFQDTNSLSQSGSAFIDQFSQSPDLAPTGKQIAEKAGLSTESPGFIPGQIEISEEQRARQSKLGGNYGPASSGFNAPSPAGAAGLAIDIVADPVNLIPFAAIAKGVGKGTKFALKGSAAATDAAFGTKIVKAGEVVADTSKVALEATRSAKVRLSKLFKPEVAEDFVSLKKIAESNNIDTSWMPEAIEFGEDSVISRAARNKAEGPLGGTDLEKFNKFSQDVSKAAENKIIKISGAENIPGKQEAGRLLREGYDKGVEEFFKDMDFTYDSVIQQAPGISLSEKSQALINSKMNGIEKKAKGLLTRGITATDRSQGKELLNAVSAYRKAGPGLKQQREALKMIGRTAFKSTNGAELPSDIRSLQEMYFSLNKGFIESTREKLGDDIANSLIENNKAMSQHFTDRGPIAKIIGNKGVSDEAAFEALIMRGDSKKIDALKSIVPAETFNKLKASYVDNLLNRNADEVINFNSTRKKLNAKKDQLKNILTEDEMQEIDDVLKLGDRAGISVLSTSGTGASNQFRSFKQSTEDFIINETFLDRMKSGARNRAESLKPTSVNGVSYSEKLAPKQSKSGIQLLRENSPITKGQAAKASRVDSINERNKKLDFIKKQRGL